MRKTAIVTSGIIVLAVVTLLAVNRMFWQQGAPGMNPAACGGRWYTYNDAVLGGNSQVDPLKKSIVNGGYCVSLQGVTGNKLGWDFIGMGVTLGEKCGCQPNSRPANLTAYSTLSFKISGAISGGTLIVRLPYMEYYQDKGKTLDRTLTDWADYEYNLNQHLRRSWTRVNINLKKDLRQPQWAKKIVPITEVLKNAHELDFHFSSPNGDAVTFAVSDVLFE